MSGYGSKLRVLFCAKSCPATGGVESWLVDLATNLGQYGIEVAVGLARGPHYHQPADFLAAHQELGAIETIVMDAASGTRWGCLRAAQSVIRKVKPDIVVPVLCQDALHAAIIEKARTPNLRIVYPIHENDYWVYRSVELFHQYMDVIVSVNRLFLKVLRERLNVPASRLAHIRCGAREPTNVQSRIGYGENIVHIGFCGKLNHWQKRVLDLPRLCEALERRRIAFRLTLAGADGGDEQRLRESIAKWSARGEVEFLGQLSRQELYDKFYPSIDALIIPSTWETGPIVAWEAMLHGVAVVSSKYRGSRCEGILAPGRTALLFDIGDMDGAADNIGLLQSQPGLGSQIAAGAREVARTCLTERHTTAKWGQLLSDVFQSPAAPSVGIPRIPRFDRWNETYGLPADLANILRKTLGRPFRSASPEQEWLSHVKYDDHGEAAHFDRWLRQFELECCKVA